MKKIDTFMFNNELDVLQIRFETLFNHVDYFVLAESNKTHLGDPKPFYYEENKHLFSKYADKIIHKKTELKSQPGWSFENEQRYTLSKYLKELDLEDDDLILNSDCDEIWRPDALWEAKSHPYCFFNQMYFIYYCDLFTNKCVTGSAAIKYGVLKRFDDQYRNMGLQCLRNSKDYGPTIENGGWHYSYFGTAETISQKSRSIADASHAKDLIKTSPENIEKERLQALITLRSPYSPRSLRKLNLDNDQELLFNTTAKSGKWVDQEGVWNIKPSISKETLFKLSAPCSPETLLTKPENDSSL